MKKPDWDRRIQRAAELAGRHPGAAEVLDFYEQVLRFQQGLYSRCASRAKSHAGLPQSFRSQLDVEAALQHLPALLRLARQHGPSKLAAYAEEIAGASSELQQNMLTDYLATDTDDADTASRFFARALLQPCAECLAMDEGWPAARSSGTLCPLCGGKPQFAVLRPEGDGGKRFLGCSFCFAEWEYRRLVCPVCGEEHNEKLPRYSAEGIAAVFVQACDTCMHYLKAVDLTIDGNAVPLVDEVASAPLDLWAAEHGYEKMQRNLLGF